MILEAPTAPERASDHWRARLSAASGLLALIRLAAVPLFFAAERLVDHPVQNSEPFGTLLIGAGLYAAAAFSAELRGGRVAPPAALAAVDLLLISALVATSGGPFSELRYAFFILPIAAALLLRPGATVLASGAIVAAYAIIAVTYSASDERGDVVGFEVTQVLFLAWMGAAAALLSSLLARRAREITALAETRTALASSRGRLVAQALDAEDDARRRLAEALHDNALQNLLAARHELRVGPQARLDLVAEAVDETVRQLREAVFDLHPYLLEQGGLGAALGAVAERAAHRGGFEVDVEVEQEALGLHDQLLFSIARELIANVAQHAQATKIWIAVRKREATVDLSVADDGRGIDLEQASVAPRDGHIGLVSSAERAEAVGGRFMIGPGPSGVGTMARVRLPVTPGPGAVASDDR